MGKEHGWACTCWSNWGIKRKSTGSWNRDGGLGRMQRCCLYMQRWDHESQGADGAELGTEEDVTGLLGHLDIPLAHVQPVADQHQQVFFCMSRHGQFSSRVLHWLNIIVFKLLAEKPLIVGDNYEFIRMKNRTRAATDSSLTQTNIPRSKQLITVEIIGCFVETFSTVYIEM